MAISIATIRNDIDDWRSALSDINGVYSTLDTARNTLVGQLESSAMRAYYGDAFTAFERGKGCLEAVQSDLAALFKKRLLDRTATQVEFPGMYLDTVEEALKLLWEAYISAGSTETANTITVGTPVKTHTGASTGNLITTKKLPGNIAPGQGLLNYYGWQGIDSQMVESDSYQCLTRDGAKAIISGRPPQNVPWGQFSVFGNPGFGSIPCDGSANLISGAFESFTTDVPDGWTLSTGTASSTCLEEATEYYLGAKSLELNGANVLTFPIATLVSAGQNLLCSIRGKRHASTSAGTVTLRMKGTGMTSQTTTFNATSLSTSSWTEQTAHFGVPLSIPSDLTLEIETASVSATGVWLDALCLQPYVYWAGLGWAITLGQNAMIPGDQWTGDLTNGYGSNRATFALRVLGFQFPKP